MPQWERVTFDQIADEFLARAHRMVWCSFATVDGRGRPTSRILHPIWEEPSEGSNVPPPGWILTRPSSPKARDLATNPFVSLGYVAEVSSPLYVECEASWVETLPEKEHAWQLFRQAPPPLGFDPASIFGSIEHPDSGVLKLRPWRIQIGVAGGSARQTWLRA